MNFDRNLRIRDHAKFLIKKTNYIINSFISIRKASMSVRFRHNTWQLFIWPLLDYTNVYLNYIPPNDKEIIWGMDRQTLRAKLFLKPCTPTYIINSLVQYP